MTFRPFSLLVLFVLAALSILPLDRTGAAIGLTVAALVFPSAASLRASDSLPLFLLSTAYFLGFALPGLAPSLYFYLYDRVLEPDIGYGALWAFRGFCMFALGYVWMATRRHATGSPVPPETDRTARWLWRGRSEVAMIGLATLVGWAGEILLYPRDLVFIAGAAVDITSLGSSVQQALHMLSELRYPIVLALLVIWRCGGMDRRLAYVGVAVLASLLADIVALGAKESIIRILVMLAIAPAFGGERVSLRYFIYLGVMGLLMFPIFLVFWEYREIMRNIAEVSGAAWNPATQIGSFVEAILRVMEGETSMAPLDDEGADLLGRFGGGIYSLANLLAFTDGRSPYENWASSFLVPVYSVFPRVLTPDRPVFFASGIYATEYFGWEFGGISVSTIGSFYYAWGYWGIVLGMLALGAMLGRLYCGAMNQDARNTWQQMILFCTGLLLLADVGVTFHNFLTSIIRAYLALKILGALAQSPHVQRAMFRGGGGRGQREARAVRMGRGRIQTGRSG